jgi:OmpA family
MQPLTFFRVCTFVLGATSLWGQTDTIFLKQMEETLQAPGDSIAIAARFYIVESEPVEVFAEAGRLETVKDFLILHSTLKIALELYTDCRGRDDYNAALCRRRAEQLRRYLLSAGITPDRIKAKGMGETTKFSNCKNCKDCLEADHQSNKVLIIKIL